jgi:hypothetical protein
MTVKISLTLDESAVKFVDNLGSNRSQIINQIIHQAKKQDLENRLKKAYLDQNQDPQFWSEFQLWDSTVGDGLESK